MKFTVSAWAGGGGTTLTLILAKNLKLQYYSGGEVFRYLGKKLEFENTGLDRIKADQYLEKYFGKIYDQYLDSIILNDKIDNIIIDTDIAAFRIGKVPNLFSIFLTASKEGRTKRLAVDNREADIEFLENRDLENAKFYKELYNIDWLNPTEIKQKHSLVIDNSEISITEELRMIYEKLGVKQKNVDLQEKEFWDLGKEGYKNLLSKLNLIKKPEEIVKEIAENYKKEIKSFPKELQNIL